MRYYQQLDITDCGAACLAMISSHFGKSLSIADIRDNAGTDVVGTNLNGLITAAKKYGLTAHAFKGDKNVFNRSVPVPFIAHMHIERGENNWVEHYVVVKRIGKSRIEIWDPDPLEKKKKID